MSYPILEVPKWKGKKTRRFDAPQLYQNDWIGWNSFNRIGSGQGASADSEQPGAGKGLPMPRRRLGKTGVEVPVLALGGMFDTINNQLLLRQSLNWGVNFWDTAEMYGNGQSEEGYGRFFARNPDARKDIFLSTKVRPNTPETMTESLDKGLKRLSTDYLDLFYVHCVDEFSEIAAPKHFKEWG